MKAPTTRHSTIWIFAEMMKAPGTAAELCERFGTKAPALSRTFAILKSLGLIYVRTWQPRASRTVRWSAVWDTQSTPFELKDAPRPESAYSAARNKRKRPALTEEEITASRHAAAESWLV